MKEKMKKLIVANWKMNPEETKSAVSLYKNTKKLISNKTPVEVVVCPPFVYLPLLAKEGTTKKISLGAQDVHADQKGSFTGKVSAKMLNDLGVRYAIVGHSEVRKMGETDFEISNKIASCLKNSITPILCVGESNRDNNEYFSFIKSQLENSLSSIPKVLIKKVIIAYEPIWAIGENATREATAIESCEMSLFIKKTISDIAGTKAVDELMVLYGGSVNDKNALSILSDGGMNGLLVGRASLNTKTFSKILEAVENIQK